MCYKIYNTESGVQKRGPSRPILVEDLLKSAIFDTFGCLRVRLVKGVSDLVRIFSRDFKNLVRP